MVAKNLEGLGLCEHCGTLLSIEKIPVEAMDSEWRCPNCDRVLTHLSFGYRKVSGKDFKKSQWVGPDGKWTTDKPKEDFVLGELTILARPVFPITC